MTGRSGIPSPSVFPDANFENTRLSYEDREGNTWVGSYGGGLVFCHSPRVQRYTEADGLPHSKVKSLAEDRDGRIWIGTLRGTACLEGDEIHSTDAGPRVCAIEVDRRGLVWIGDSEGNVSRRRSSDPQPTIVLAEEVLNFIVALCEDEAGRLWVCRSHGSLGYIEEDHFTALERLPPRCKTMMQDSKGVLWIGTADRSPALHYKDQDHLLQAVNWAGLREVSEVNALCEHEGLFWVGTPRGLLSVDPRSGCARRYTMDQGLPANNILSLGRDREGLLWIGTNGGGVLKYSGEAFHRVHIGKSSAEDQVNAILCDSQGQLWFGTSGGLTMYRPRRGPLGIVIRQVVEGRLVEAPDAVSFPEDATQVEIHFQGIRFRLDEEPMVYSHRLAGHGPAGEWSEFTPANKVSYRDLPVGEYRFEVRTRDPEGMVSEAAHLQVRVVPDTDWKSRRRVKPGRQRSVETVSGHSPTIARLLSQLRQVAETDMIVLLQGETGTGKGLVAREIHDLSPRRKRAFVHVNCGTLTSTLVESELFGHEKGAFTGAGRRKTGLFQQAHEGTLFLDEIGDLPPAGQQALLHILEDGLVRRVGGVKSSPVDVRVLAATNRGLEGMVREETFREDLYYRLRTFPVEVPPLRDRREEIPALAAHFAAECARQLRRPAPTLSEEALGYLQEHSWPGNVRELENLMRRGVILCEGEVLEAVHVSLPAADEGAGEAESATPSAEALDALQAREKQTILQALQATRGRIYGEQGAASLLGMNPERLRSRMRVYGLRKSREVS